MRDPVKGDKVVHYGRKAIVTSVYYNFRAQRICEIEYLDNNIPYYEEVVAERLVIASDSDGPPPFNIKMSKKKYWIDPAKACPICETPWTITKFGNNTWYDCKPCKMTKEQIDKEE